MKETKGVVEKKFTEPLECSTHIIITTNAVLMQVSRQAQILDKASIKEFRKRVVEVMFK